MTKEPKLQAAVRIVAEWSDYDQEIKRFQNRVQEGANGAAAAAKETHGNGSGRVETKESFRPRRRLRSTSNLFLSPQTTTQSCEELRLRGAGAPHSV